MKRLLALLSLVCALFLASACHYDINLSVDASANLYYPDGDVITIQPVTYEGFHHNALSDSDLEYIFTDLTKKASQDFSTAELRLDIYDAISGSALRQEIYGVIYNAHTGHFDFALMP